MKLYGKLVLWFLLANLVAVAVTVMIGARIWVSTYTDEDTSRDARQAVQIYEAAGAESLEDWLRQRRKAGVYGRLFDEQGAALTRGFLPAPPALRERLRPLYEGRENVLEMPDGDRARAATVVSADGRKYRWIAIIGQPRGRIAHLYAAGLQTGIGLLVIAAVALFAARRINRPITDLREATVRLADGALDTRVPDDVARRTDELGELGRSFNDMAARLQALLESQRQLLRDVSHELRSPLARLRIASELARESPREQHFARIEQEADRLDELIGQALLIARLQSPVAPGEKARVDLAGIVRDVCDDAGLEAQQRCVKVEAQMPETCMVNGQAALLKSALENVVRNAVRYTHENTAVSVRLDPVADHWRILVTDCGPGVPEDQLGEIFKPFVRVSNARERDSGGYGLGLAIAQSAIAAHGGSITAENLPQGGLRVEIRLPSGIP